MIVFGKDKDTRLRAERNVSFEDFAELIEKGRFIDIIINPAYEGQNIFIIRYKEYTYAVPYEFDQEDNIILKTIYPSRKYHKIYGLK